MNKTLRWFVWLLRMEILFSGLLAVAALLVPSELILTLAQQRADNTMRLLEADILARAVGCLLLLLASFSLPAALSPTRYPLVAWLAAGSQCALALSRLLLFGIKNLSAISGLFCLADVGVGLALVALLQASPTPETKLSWSNLRQWIGARQVLAEARANLKAALANRWVQGALLLALLAGLPLGYGLWHHLLRQGPLEQFASDEDHFKHGNIGNEKSRGMPYYLWEVLPEMFADKLPGPGGWASLGFMTEAGRYFPVGFSKRTVGFPMLSPNCALCHSSRYRRSASDQPRFVPGGPAAELDFNGFIKFLGDCADDPRFHPAVLTDKIAAKHQLSAFERQVYRRIILPLTRRALQLMQREFVWMKLRPAAGPGRMDAVNVLKINLFRGADDGTIGTSDYLPVWNQAARGNLGLRWNCGGVNLAQENLLAAAFLLNLDSAAFDSASFKRVAHYLQDLKPPPFPFLIDQAAAQRGQTIFRQHCASCHAFGAAEVGRINPVQQVGTDPAYINSWTEKLVDGLKAVRSGEFHFDAVRLTDGYNNLPLDGCWARAPYLHNGSVPGLWDLLQPDEKRPVRFYRGYNVYDPEKMGFVSDGTEARRFGFEYDTRLSGNGNQGHAYGTNLHDTDKSALIEYLKTL